MTGTGNGIAPAVAPFTERETLPRSAFVAASPGGAYDVIIAGGGPAGMTCALYLMRKRIDTLMISPDLGGQVRWTSNIENYPGYLVVSGIDLAEKYKEQLQQFPLAFLPGEKVVAMETHGYGGMVRTGLGAEYSFKALVIATGKRSEKLGVPGEDRLYGRGVSHCATCDGPLYRNEPVAVVGGGNSALSAAIDLLAIGCTVHLVNITPDLQADGILVEKAVSHNRLVPHLHAEILEILGDRGVTGIRIRDLATGQVTDIPLFAVFIEIGLVPNSDLAEGIVGMNRRREVMVDCRCMTDIPCVFAAGDVTDAPNKQIVIAAGEGAKAALSVADYLKKLR
jgi:alkyl hydroperoxide reductase subunit F